MGRQVGHRQVQLLREALHRQLVRLAAEHEITAWTEQPLASAESSLGQIADWGPAEDWSDWADERGDVWFVAIPGGDRPVLVLTRDQVADRICSIAVAALTRITRGLVSELELTVAEDGVPSDCVVNFDNPHTIPREMFRRFVVQLSPARMAQACRRLHDATRC